MENFVVLSGFAAVKSNSKTAKDSSWKVCRIQNIRKI